MSEKQGEILVMLKSGQRSVVKSELELERRTVVTCYTTRAQKMHILTSNIRAPVRREALGATEWTASTFVREPLRGGARRNVERIGVLEDHCILACIGIAEVEDDAGLVPPI